ncbi:HAD-like protein [Yamadazyma tenuis ATCC 10573]|uniref:HAD-like protein n=2 Tax=Candida tenuis TaxID=2315449 RepID=G3AZ36_CANTC|nr:HAD-like protein [Yamadazyma tenuis ATCC 10573]EGV65997.1 HAD-like protein [Yamadazyma tenuis ATCC 10573]
MKTLVKTSLQFARSVTNMSVPLISDPLTFNNARKIRDTNTVFSKPNFVSFDAFGTLYVPKKPVHIQYHEIASEQFGIDKSAESIKQSFPVIHNQLLQEFPNYGKDSKEITSTDQWWSELIVRLFDLKHYSQDQDSLDVCNSLINRFKSSKGYHLYEDVIPTLSKLKENDITVLVSSNSDPRVYDILESLGLDQYIDNVYISYHLSHEKPSKKFFDLVANSQISNIGSLPADKRSSFLENCWHVGDSHDKDYVGSVRSGWNGVLIDRDVKSGYLNHPMPSPEAESPSCMTGPAGDIRLGNSSRPAQIIADNRVIVSDLTQILSLFGLD